MRSRGFTLIELLVVIAIIGLLTAIGMAAFGQAKTKAQDTRRIDDMRELEKALALYATTYHKYPVSSATTTLTGSDSVSTALLNAEVLPSIPQDPTPIHEYTYRSDTTGSTYFLSFCLDTDSIPNFSSGCGNIISP